MRATANIPADVEAVLQIPDLTAAKVRRDPPSLGDPDAPKIGVLTPEQVEEALFG